MKDGNAVLKKEQSALPKRFSPLEEQRDSLLSDSQNVVITDSSSYKVVRNLRTTIQRVISETKEIKKEIKGPYMEYLDSVEQYAKSVIDPLEDRKSELIEKIKAHDERVAEEKRLKEEQERQRITELKDAINDHFEALMLQAQQCETAEEIAHVLEESKTPIKQEWLEFEAEYVQKLNNLTEYLETQHERIQEQERLRKELEESERKSQIVQSVNNYYRSLEQDLSECQSVKQVEAIKENLDNAPDMCQSIEEAEELQKEWIAKLNSGCEHRIAFIKSQAELDQLRKEKEEREAKERAKAEEEAKKRAEEEAKKRAEEDALALKNTYVSVFKKSPGKKTPETMRQEIAKWKQEQSLMKMKDADNAAQEVANSISAAWTEAHGNFPDLDMVDLEYRKGILEQIHTASKAVQACVNCLKNMYSDAKENS